MSQILLTIAGNRRFAVESAAPADTGRQIGFVRWERLPAGSVVWRCDDPNGRPLLMHGGNLMLFEEAFGAIDWLVEWDGLGADGIKLEVESCQS